MLTVRMNENAAAALDLLSEGGPAAPAVSLDDQLNEMLSHGLTYNDDALVLAAHHTGALLEGRVPAREAMARMGWDLTMYEVQHSSFHLEGHADVRVELLDDGEPRISDGDQVILLRLGLQIADRVVQLVRALPKPVPVRCIIGANETSGTFRFHQLRPDQSWLLDDLDGYRQEKLITVDIMPVPPSA